MALPPIHSQITFLYYDDLSAAAAFYTDVLLLEVVAEHQMGTIYRAAGQAYIGIVDAAQGQHPARPENSVVISLTVDSVDEWFDRLETEGVKMLSRPQEHELAPVRSFFFEDPGGYTLEIQRFIHPEQRAIFLS